MPVIAKFKVGDTCRKWRERVQGRLDIFKGIKKELYQMEQEIKNIQSLERAEKAKEHLAELWKVFKGTCLEEV